MNLDDLIKEGKISPFDSTIEEIKRPLEIAHRDLEEAKKLLSRGSLDWSFIVAYNATLQTSRAYMFIKGFRPKERDGHKAVFQFLDFVVPKWLKETVSFFDRARKKRHSLLYDQVGAIGEREVRSLISELEKFLLWVETEFKKKFK